MTAEALRIVRFAAIGLIGVLAFVWLGVGLGYLQSERPVSKEGEAFGNSMIVPFQLIDQTAKPVSERDVLGKPSALFFGFTYCPDVCPTTLASLSAMLGQMGPDADRLGVFLVTVDPERDTPEVLKQYLSAFDKRIRGLTGSPAQIELLTKALGVYAARVNLDGGGYTMDHTASVFLLDAQGRFRGTIAYGEEREVAVAKLKKLLER
ncbi:MAG: SCO family protein [Alphaproteobacteria bacterium]|nr:SCO family protein [Alphaproteobacteria bacterium]